jgi:hypothetical protein
MHKLCHFGERKMSENFLLNKGLTLSRLKISKFILNILSFMSKVLATQWFPASGRHSFGFHDKYWCSADCSGVRSLKTRLGGRPPLSNVSIYRSWSVRCQALFSLYRFLLFCVVFLVIWLLEQFREHGENLSNGVFG